jgi:PrcB C-terminal
MTELSSIAKGDGSGVSSPRRIVVRDDRAWRALWSEHAGTSAAAPAVDFDTHMVAAVFAGDRPTPGYGVEITDVRRQGDTLDIIVSESRPAPGMMAAQVIVTPFHIVALPRFDGHVSFA